MNPEAPPPSYNEIYKTGPTAPPIDSDFSAAVQPNNIGWNPQPPPTFSPVQQNAAPSPMMPMQAAQQTIVIVQEVVSFGNASQQMTCPHCKQVMWTKLEPINSLSTHLLAGLFCLVLCWWPCACLTYCGDCTKNIEHKCRNCHKTLGVFQRFK